MNTRRRRLRNFGKKGKTWLTEYSFVAPAFLFLIVFMAYPVLYNFILSIQDVKISNLVSGDAAFCGLQNYIAVFKDPYFKKAFFNTIIFMAVCLSFQFIFGMLLALYYNKDFAGAKWMRAIILVGWMNPVIITGAIFKWLFSGDSGVVNYILMHLGLIQEPVMFLTSPKIALATITLANVWVGIPFNMILLLTGLQSLPTELYEAAAIDGASKPKQFFKITLPLLKPTISILLMMGIIYTFKVFDLIYIMTKGGPARSSQTLPYYSYEQSFQTYKYGRGAAVSMIIFVFIMVFAFFYLRSTKKEEEM